MKRVLHSCKGLGWVLGIPLEELEALLADLERHYKPFAQEREGKEPRIIDRPVGPVKNVQRLIRRRFLAGQPLDEGVRACVKGGSPFKNATVHTRRRNFAKVDVKNCYPSITNAMAFRVYRSLGFGPKTASMLTRFSTRLGHLPQGAPTSDMITNLVLRPVDQRVKEICEQFKLERGRCMDDIAVSGDEGTRQAIGLVIAAIREIGLAVRHKKTVHAGPSAPHNLTGFNVNGPSPKVVRSKVQEIRTDVYQAVLAHRRGENVDSRLPSLRGSLGYLRRTNPGIVRRLERQLQAAGIVLNAKSRRRR